jgi:predicted nucleic acid-binding protein
MPNNPNLPSNSTRVVFVDTSAIAAVMNEGDQHHEEAIGRYKEMVEKGYSLVLTNFVIAETHALLLNTTRNIPLGLQWLNDVAYTDFTVIRPSKTEEEEALQFLSIYKDKLWSLVDALSFTIMQKLSILYYFSFDEDFRQTGRFLDITHYLDYLDK